MNKAKILFLAANPSGTSQLKLDEEIRAIAEKIRLSEYRDSLELISAWAVRPDDLLQLLNLHKPDVVHFSGHGNQAGELVFVGRDGQPKAIDTRAIRALFTTLKENIKVVVLNACYSKTQAKAIVNVIDCVIGMSNAIGDEAAIIFAASFYRAVGFGYSIEKAFEQGKTAIMLEGIREQLTPKLLVKSNIDSSTLYILDNHQNVVKKTEKPAFEIHIRKHYRSRFEFSLLGREGGHWAVNRLYLKYTGEFQWFFHPPAMEALLFQTNYAVALSREYSEYDLLPLTPDNELHRFVYKGEDSDHFAVQLYGTNVSKVKICAEVYDFNTRKTTLVESEDIEIVAADAMPIWDKPIGVIDNRMLDDMNPITYKLLVSLDYRSFIQKLSKSYREEIISELENYAQRFSNEIVLPEFEEMNRRRLEEEKHPGVMYAYGIEEANEHLTRRWKISSGEIPKPNELQLRVYRVLQSLKEQ